MKKCEQCGHIFEDPDFDEKLEIDVCPECGSEDFSEYDEGYEAYNSTQREPHEKSGWEDES